MFVCVCMHVCEKEGVAFTGAGKRGSQGHKSQAIYPPLSPVDWKKKARYWCQKRWINGDLQQDTNIGLTTALVCFYWNSLVFLIVVMQLLCVPTLQLPITHSANSILHGQRAVSFVSMSFNWKRRHNVHMCNVVPEWVQRSPAEHVEKFTRPSGVNGSALEERERGLIQHSAQDSQENGDRDRQKRQVHFAAL